MNKNLRVAWLLPVCWYYWQPALKEFSQYFPQTKIFTGLFPGFVEGLENSLEVELVGKFKPLSIIKNKQSYGSGVTLLSPKVIFPLFKYQPQIIFSSSFGIWTIIALLLKPWRKWQVIIAYEGSSPGVDFRNSRLRLLIRRIMVLAADAAIANSQAGKSYLIEVLQAHRDRVFAHPYEVPALELLGRSQKPQADYQFSQARRPIFLSVGRIVKRKGIDILLKACKQLNDFGKTNYTVLLVGDGEEKPYLEAFTQEHNLEPNVRWLGRVEYNQINNYYQNCDVFILPTWEDTWGVVVLEVMLFGKPVICSLGAGSSELIIEQENGYTFDPNHPQQLAQLMAKFIDNLAIATEMGLKSQQEMTKYTPAAAGLFLKQVLDSCLNPNLQI